MIVTAKDYGYTLPAFMALPMNMAMATILTEQRIRRAEKAEHDKALAELKHRGNK